MIESEFERTEGSEPVGFSDSDSSFVVQTLDHAAGEQPLSAEVVEDQLSGRDAEQAGDEVSLTERVTCGDTRKW